MKKIKNKEVLPKQDNNLYGIYFILDFKELSKEYDAIEVFISEDSELYFSLYGLDCDSIIVMNPCKIIIENE